MLQIVTVVLRRNGEKELGIFVLPMPFYIDGELYFEDISIRKIFIKVTGRCGYFHLSHLPGDLMDFWENILKEYDEIVHIPMSSGLSGSCQSKDTGRRLRWKSSRG
ncbi:MAG: DegV family protein [[Ruminococcus] lactaris]|uniref:DegV family protein n=1 Tax=[Ruminococcus] lactaris TaxID=46228 RepID=UPI003999FB7A